MKDQIHTFVCKNGIAWLPVPELMYQMHLRGMKNVTDVEHLIDSHALSTSALILQTGSSTDLFHQLMHYKWIQSDHIEHIDSFRALKDKFW